jgi:anti-sigma regulatory factor (Ser/Thr protein kinase)
MALSDSRTGAFSRPPLETDGRVTTLKTQKPRARELVSARPEFLLRLHLESNPEALCLVRATLQRAAEVLHFPEHESRAIVRSVDEALANIIRHAYQGRPGMPIDVSCWRLWQRQDAKAPKGIEIVLSDSGAAADIEKLKGRSLDEIRPGGLGLHLIEQSMDVVELRRRRGKNFLRLVKYLVRPRPEESREGE